VQGSTIKGIAGAVGEEGSPLDALGFEMGSFVLTFFYFCDEKNCDENCQWKIA